MLRSSAILLVVLCHGLNFFAFAPFVRTVQTAAGFFGVELFFVLSGFLVGGSLLERYLGRDNIKNWVGDFFATRWLRTLPNYYLFLLISIALEFAWFGEWPSPGAYFVLLQNFAWPQSRLFAQSWSLAVEELFYLSLPLALWACVVLPATKEVRFLTACAILFLISFGLRVYEAFGPAAIDSGIRQVAVLRLDALIVGVLGYYAYRKYSAVRSRKCGLVGLSLFAFASVPLVGDYGDYAHNVFWRIFWFPLCSIGFACVLVGFLEHFAVPEWMMAPTRSIAKWSYSIYLINSPVLISLLTWGPLPQANSLVLDAALLAAYLGTTLVLSRLVYVHFELKALNWYRVKRTSLGALARA